MHTTFFLARETQAKILVENGEFLFLTLLRNVLLSNQQAPVARNYPLLFNILFTYLFFNQMSLLFHLFSLNLTCSCPYSYNLINVINSNLHVSTLCKQKVKKKGGGGGNSVPPSVCDDTYTK
jgi:hypothetical protein